MSGLETCLLYGASGFTGQHVARLAASKGLKFILSGRDKKALSNLSLALDMPYRVFDITDVDEICANLEGVECVLHCAGPFAITAQPMVEACLRSGCHYLDINGEVPVYEHLATYQQQARSAGIMVMSGCGFDMVPGDCLALALKRKMPDATELDIGLRFKGGLSRGTIRSAMTNLSAGVLVRQAHKLSPLEDSIERQFDFGEDGFGGWQSALASTFGDVSIAWHSTGIPTIRAWLVPAQEFAALASLESDDQISALPAGPSAEEMAKFKTVMVGEARNASGNTVAMRLVMPQIYAITFVLALDIACRVVAGQFRKGFQTPASVFGEDYICEFEGCELMLWKA